MPRILVVSASARRACRIERSLMKQGSPVSTAPDRRHVQAAPAQVVVSTTEADAVLVARGGSCDLVMVDAADPVSDPFCLCRLFKALQLPVVVLSDPNRPWQRLLALDAGADEFAGSDEPHPALLRRVKSVAALAGLLEEYGRTATLLGLSPTPLDRAGGGNVLLADPERASRERLSQILAGEYQVDAFADPDLALRHAASGSYDVAIVSAAWPDRQDAQVLTHQIRGLDHRRSLRVIALSDSPDGAGETADDAITRPIDRCEAIARVRVMVQRSRLFGLCRGTDGGAFRWGAGRAVFPDRRPPPERYAA